MRNTHRTIAAAVGVLAIAALSLTGCSADSGSDSNSGSDQAKQSQSQPKSSPSDDSSSMDASADLIGSACASYAKKVPSGPGSVKGMAQDPVATAASNNPLLTTLVSAVSGKLNPKVNLVDTLNSGQYTVFAPVDDAFKKIDSATIDALKKPSGADTLTKILTYHVISGRLSPSEMDGSHKTLEGSDVKVTGSGDDMMVNGKATVICGGVKTANATVYLLDTVLMPPSK